ncbi:MAG: DEAD/DEAH box helicase [Alphaproteobacteria bacterium]|nr:DEAD/DEAH box helicase [Alphaproteobacteria bacterium]
MSFSDLGLSEQVLKAVSDAGYQTPTPIQAQAIPYVLMGRDVLGIAQTGTGKTASFTLPMIDILSAGRAKARMPRSLILEPTRELAAQVAENFDTYGKYTKLSKALLIGGVSFSDQEQVLDRGVDVLIATPGRLMDQFERGKVLLNDVKLLVIDEADRMLDMGFIPDIEKIVGFLPKIRQTLFFSATMPPEIRRLTETFLINPKQISVAPASKPTVENVTQGLIVVPTAEAKRDALRTLLTREPVKNALIFCNRKRDIGALQKSLERHGFNAGALHGDMHQSVRTETLEKFKSGGITLLVCSDVAARGLDIDDMSHVINFDVPIHAEDYIHRIGRTARAGRPGTAFTLATPADGKFVSAIERLIHKEIPRVEVDGLSGAALEADDGRRRRGSAPKGEPRAKAEPRPKAEPRSRARAEDAPIPIDAAAPMVVHSPAPTPTATVTPFRQRPRHDDREDRTPVVGLGDHVPAFLLRTVKAVGSVRG